MNENEKIEIVFDLKSIIGQTYGNLLIIHADKSITNKIRNDILVWYRCLNCGSRGITTLSDIRINYNKKCVCSGNKQRSIDLEKYVGRQFHELRVLDTVRGFGIERGLAYCKCSCGNYCMPEIGQVIRPTKSIMSCGHLGLQIKLDNAEKLKFRHKKYNEYEIINNNIAKVKFSNCEEYFMVDLITWNYLKKFTWNKCIHKYPRISILNKINKTRREFWYHQLLLNCSDGYVRDHIDRNRSNNTYNNLRIIPIEANARNRTLSENNTSGYTGVCYNQKSNRWSALIRINGETIYKYFSTLDEAVAWRQLMEQQYYTIEGIPTERLVLSDGSLNPNFDYSQIYPLTMEDLLKEDYFDI